MYVYDEHVDIETTELRKGRKSTSESANRHRSDPNYNVLKVFAQIFVCNMRGPRQFDGAPHVAPNQPSSP